MPGNWEQKAQLMRVAVLPIPDMKIFYTNALQTKIVRGGLFAHSFAFPGRKGTRKAPSLPAAQACLCHERWRTPDVLQAPFSGLFSRTTNRIAAQ